MGRVAVRTEADDLHQIIGSAGGGEIFENGKIEQCLGSGEAPTQVLPGIFLLAGVFELPDQVAEGTVQQNLLVLVAAAKLRGLNGVEIAPPSIAVAAPLRMQCRHSYEGAPQRHAGAHEALTQTIENRRGIGAANSFAYHPHVQFDDLPAERDVEIQRRQGHRSRACLITHGSSKMIVDYRLQPHRSYLASVKGTFCLALFFLPQHPSLVYASSAVLRCSSLINHFIQDRW